MASGSGRFTAGDVPGIQDRLGVAVDARDLKLDGTKITGQVTVPTAKRQWVDTVIVLKLDGSAEELPIIDVPAVVTVHAVAGSDRRAAGEREK